MLLQTTLCISQVHKVVSYLKKDAEKVDKRDEITLLVRQAIITVKRANTHMSVPAVAHAIINLTASRNKPPVSTRENK